MRLISHSLYAGTALALAFATPATAQNRTIVDASTPVSQAVTVYRDPERGMGGEMERDWPRGFAMISETRTVTLPPGQSTIRFTGVAEGMVAVSAIVTGLPGGTIEKNRNADLLSPAALVDGTLGNRVRITRTNPGTGAETVDSAIIRTRADGGLVLQTDEGYEAVRCSGLPERLTFDHVPDGLSAEPVFSIDTADRAGGTYTVTLSYLAWGFDWEANYVATFNEAGDADDVRLKLVSWLTILNDNGQTFEDAELLAVAGRLNVESDFAGLSDPPTARPLRLTCFPIGSTAAGSPIQYPLAPPPPPPPAPMMMARAEMAQADAQGIVVTGSRMVAREENLGDLKLYRIPERLDVAAQSLKQVAFLDQDAVTGQQIYRGQCFPGNSGLEPAQILFSTTNDKKHGLGVALPMGQIAFFEPSAFGEQLVAQEWLRDYAEGQEVEIALGQSSQVMVDCQQVSERDRGNYYDASMRASVSNANPHPVQLRMIVAYDATPEISGQRSRIKDGRRIIEIDVPANGTRLLEWRSRDPQ